CDLIVDECHEAELIDVPDWTVPTEDHLIAFGKILIKSQQQRQYIVGHCIAGDGRTGTMIMFVLMFSLKIFDPVQLFIQLAKKYKLRAANEILYLIQTKATTKHKLNYLFP